MSISSYLRREKGRLAALARRTRNACATKGVTLIMVAGVLAVLAALGGGFYSLMISQGKSALHYGDGVRAELMARSGIEDAIGRLREQAYLKTEDPSDAWYMVDYQHNAARRVSFPALLPASQRQPGSSPEMAYSRALSSSAGINSDRYVLNVSDAGGKVNINHCDNLGVLLDNLCRAIGPPMIAANINMLQPARWALEGAGAEYNTNATDSVKNRDIYHVVDTKGTGKDDVYGYPTRNSDGTAIYGDGYAIAAYRARNGLYNSIEDIKQALTATPNPQHPELETLEREIKFNAIRDYITIDSWVDTNTVCVGKFEWVDSSGLSLSYADPNGPSAATSGNLKTRAGQCQILIDRDKSWVNDDPINDPQNNRGSLRGCYVSIMNGHGAGQMRRIATNGADWIAIEMSTRMWVEPGPISSYMIVAKEDALTESVATNYGTVSFPKTDSSGHFLDDPAIDYNARPLCIHRAPVNINTASDKVLIALFMGINVQHGHPSAVGTDADLDATSAAWIKKDHHNREEFVLTPSGLKRVPVSSGKLILNRIKPWSDTANFDYIGNFGALGSANFKTTGSGGGLVNEAHELAYRVIMARQRSLDSKTGLPKAPTVRDLDPTTIDKASGNGFERGPFRSWDDLYFRVVKPWDDIRSFPKGDPVPNSGSSGQVGQGKASVARVIMAHFNSNTDLLKFNPNIEWIDRWGRNFTEMEAVMAYTDIPESPQSAGGFSCMGHGQGTTLANPVDDSSIPIFALEVGAGKVLGVPGAPSNDQGAYITRSYRYKSDELIDKSDLNRSTTEFSFDSNGIFSITSLGQVAKDGDILSERRIDVLIKVYDVWRESTQRQFVNGTISPAGNQQMAFNDASGNYSGQVARDADPSHATVRLALTTQPEPLVPLKFRLTKKYGRANQELMDTTFRDAYGNTRANPYDAGSAPAEVPDVLANRIQPAGYDGQIVLATNTLSFDSSGDKDTFLASFDGDLDSTTCAGNGREQAKTPNNVQIRVVDTIGLLGLLNDTEVDTDVSLTGHPYVPGSAPDPHGVKVYPFRNVDIAMVGLDVRPLGGGRTPYWQNALCRMGDLRTDGVYLSGPGVAGNDGTLKYLVGEASKGKEAHENFQVNDNDGTTISMWAKTTWHWNDNRTHEMFNCVNPGGGSRAEACYLCKDGRTKWCNLGGTTFGISDAGSRNNDFGFIFEGRNTQGVGDWSDPDYPIYLHGGYTGVPDSRLNQYQNPGKPTQPEAAAYRIQPFRWSYLGGKLNYGPINTIFKGSDATQKSKYILPRPPGDGGPPTNGGNPPVALPQLKEGYLDGNTTDNYADAESIDMAYQAGYWVRPFVDTERYPEGPGFAPAAGTMVKGTIPNTLKYKFWGCWQIQGAQPWAMPCAAGDWYDYEFSTTPGTQPGDCHMEGGMGQPMAWPWADHFKPNGPRVFSIGNLNLGDPTSAPGSFFNPNLAVAGNTYFYDVYRHLMEDGTYAVIDELKISNKTDMLCGPQDRVTREQTTSRYYLPANPGSKGTDPGSCPYFTSQTLQDALRGAGAPATDNSVTVARVTWTVFTPRFMHENKLSTKPYTRKGQWLTKMGNAATSPQTFSIPYKGPFDYDIYNNDDFINGAQAEGADPEGPRAKARYASVARPYPYEYADGQSHSTKGVEIEILNDTTPVNGAREQHRGYADFVSATTFINPDVENRLGSAASPVQVKISKLRYRVRFVYPVDPLAAPDGGTQVDPSKHYMLDTPVFDDISITYFTKPVIYAYKMVNE
ncbi:MAG TPA: hypothetical protein VKX17_08195 [Planctomycetota bacterium]|nr:hypothetical protein [Planctomycetota bacterium]